jgi:hypothetical protein
MASVDLAHASEEEVELCNLFQSPVPVSSLAKAVELLLTYQNDYVDDIPTTGARQGKQGNGSHF